MYIFDTSFLIALLYDDDYLHEKAIALLKKIDLNNNLFFINEIVYFETITVLTYKLGPQAIDTVEVFMNLMQIRYIATSRNDYIQLFKTVKKKMSLEDIATIYDALVWWLELLSFDEKQISLFDTLHE